MPHLAKFWWGTRLSAWKVPPPLVQIIQDIATENKNVAKLQ